MKVETASSRTSLREDWPDLSKPPQAAEEGEASKSAGKTGEGSKAVGKPTPTGAEGGAEAPPNVAQVPTINPPQPQPSTSKGDTQDPTDDPQEPTKNPEEENEPGLVEYVKSYWQTAKVWFDMV